MKGKLNKFKYVLAAAAIFSTLIFASCTSEIELELNKNGSVDVKFNGIAGNAFVALINAGLGTETSDKVIFNTKDIEYEMAGNGFSNIKAVSNNGTDLSVTMTDKNGKSALFTSGVVSARDGKLSATLSPQSLKSFYDSADSQTVMFLDMLLSPVFNDEIMTQEEYLEVLASFYGDEIADEIKDSSFRITLKNTDGTKTVQTINFAKLLTLNEVIRF